ncbi:MAG: chorismate mutase [Candidatus Micrarchaeia archaeon]
MSSNKIAVLRRRIDALDRRIIALLQKRARIAREIGREKRRLGLPILDRKRERAVLRNAAKAKGAFPRASLLRIYREIIRACTEAESR